MNDTPEFAVARFETHDGYGKVTDRCLKYLVDSCSWSASANRCARPREFTPRACKRRWVNTVRCFFIGAGGLLKSRLLCGALRLAPDEARAQGAGQLLGRVIESEAVESLALSGGVTSIVAVIQIITILDESFGMLDPGNFQKALRCTSTRANAMLVIAHS